MHSSGADIIFTATAGGDFGVFEAAVENEFQVLSVDVNRCVDAPGYVIDNTLKGVDAALINSVDAIMSGAKASVSAVGLKEGGMSVMALKADLLGESKCLIADNPNVIAKVREVADAIIQGDLVLPDPMFANWILCFMHARLHNITIDYGKFRAVDDVSIDFCPKQIHAVIGENGAGKLVNVRYIRL